MRNDLITRLYALVVKWQAAGNTEMEEAMDRDKPAAIGVAAIRLHHAEELAAALMAQGETAPAPVDGALESLRRQFLADGIAPSTVGLCYDVGDDIHRTDITMSEVFAAASRVPAAEGLTPDKWLCDGCGETCGVVVSDDHTAGIVLCTSCRKPAPVAAEGLDELLHDLNDEIGYCDCDGRDDNDTQVKPCDERCCRGRIAARAYAVLSATRPPVEGLDVETLARVCKAAQLEWTYPILLAALRAVAEARR